MRSRGLSIGLTVSPMPQPLRGGFCGHRLNHESTLYRWPLNLLDHQVRLWLAALTFENYILHQPVILEFRRRAILPTALADPKWQWPFFSQLFFQLSKLSSARLPIPDTRMSPDVCGLLRGSAMFVVHLN